MFKRLELRRYVSFPHLLLRSITSTPTINKTSAMLNKIVSIRAMSPTVHLLACNL
jgi:hypothetical protein